MIHEGFLVFDDPATSGNAGGIVVLVDYEAATPGDASDSSNQVQVVGQEVVDVDFQSHVLSDLDALVGIGTYLMAFMLFLVVSVLIRGVYKFIRIFI